MIAMFASGGRKVTRQQISAWLKKEDAEGYTDCSDRTLATFLNGLIREKRGKREGLQPRPENKLNNNLIFKKLRIAFNLKDTDILNILSSVDFHISKHELSAFFRAPEHRQSRQCKDQVLRKFLQGLQQQYRAAPSPDAPTQARKTRKTLSLNTPQSVWKEK